MALTDAQDEPVVRDDNSFAKKIRSEFYVRPHPDLLPQEKERPVDGLVFLVAKSAGRLNVGRGWKWEKDGKAAKLDFTPALTLTLSPRRGDSQRESQVPRQAIRLSCRWQFQKRRKLQSPLPEGRGG